MPPDFMRCVERGGRVRAKRLDRKRYLPICYAGGKSYAGEVKRYKRKEKARRNKG